MKEQAQEVQGDTTKKPKEFDPLYLYKMVSELSKSMKTAIEEAKKTAGAVTASDVYKNMQTSIDTIDSYIKEHEETIKEIEREGLGTYDKELEPYIDTEIAELSKNAGRYTGDILEIWSQVLKNAKARQLENAPRINSASLKKVDYPIDKINRGIWDDLSQAPKNLNGQIMFATEKRGSDKEATVLFSINFDDLEKVEGLKLTKQLTAFDKRVYIAVSSFFSQGGEYMSLTQIFTARGGRGKATPDKKKKIDESLTKMGATRIYVDNTFEVGVNKKYNKFKYDASLLPFERKSAYINNNLVESAIHPFREPPLTTFARERKQITTVTRKLLEIPLNQTEDNLKLEDYLIETIASMKNPHNKLSHKILYSTVYRKCKIDGPGENNKKARQRTPEKIIKCLDHFKEQEFIKDFKETANGDGIIIVL